MTDHAPHQRRAALVLAAVGGALVCATAGFAAAGALTWDRLVESYTLTNTVIGIALLASGVPAMWFTRNLVGTLLATAGLAHLASSAATALAVYAIRADWPDPVIRSLTTVSTGAWQLGIPLLFTLALLLFPDGLLPGPRWRWLAWLVVLTGLVQCLTGVLATGSSFSDAADHDSILSVGLELPGPLAEAAGIASTAAFLLVIAALATRFVRGNDRTRRQLMWLIMALLVIVALNLQRIVTGTGPILPLASAALVPAAIAVAIVKDELFDIRLVLSRTLLYSLTVGTLVSAYVAVLAVLAMLLPADADSWVSVAGAVVVAFLFAPVQRLARRAVDRAFYGRRGDPAGTAWQIGQELSHVDDLPRVIEQVRQALHLPWVALRPAGEAVPAVAGAANGSATTAIPLSYRGSAMGTLVVGLRRGERRLHEADRRTLELIATPLAVALHATALGDQLRLARAATVETAEAERQRLSRELHDGLGPVLTSIAFRADAATNLVHADPEAALALLTEIRAELRGAIDDVRRVVHGLTPVELTSAGLAAALRQRVAALPTEQPRRLEVQLELPDTLPPLTPAVELAAYRIANEALTNVLRHSDARRCRVTVRAADQLEVTVSDDGRPPRLWTPGVGLRSIAERAEELGGGAQAGPTTDGWAVRARLPLDPGLTSTRQ